jgi:hypothetical protein
MLEAPIFALERSSGGVDSFYMISDLIFVAAATMEHDYMSYS